METLFQGKAWKLQKQGSLGYLIFDLEGERVNKFAEVPLKELESVIELLKKNGGLSCLVIESAKIGSFIVGADITMIQKLKDKKEAYAASEYGQKVFAMLEDLPIPTLAAVDGPCMGGGTELILSCKYRVCSDSSKTAIGLPEVKLGILPGWGGTYRMPRLIGLMQATDLILTGKTMRGAKAEKAGLVNRCVPAAIFKEKVREYAEKIARAEVPKDFVFYKPSLQEKVLTENPIGQWIFFKKAHEEVMKTTKGHYPSPLESLELLQNHLSKPRDAYMKLEAESFSKLWATETSKNLVNLFFLAEAAKKSTGTSLSESQVKALPKINQYAVLGAGVMGAGIAYQGATNGLQAVLKDINYEALGKGLAHARSLLDGLVKKKRLTFNERDQQMASLRVQTDYKGFKSLDLVIEAIVENLDIKKKVFAELENEIRSDCIIASNTSSLKLSAMAQGLKDSSRFIGLHFFNPVHKMPLVEVVKHDGSSEEAVAKGVAFVKSIGKTPVVCKDAPGFLVNRLLLPWLTEAAWCLWEGYDYVEIDRALKDFGMPMGPFELLDEVGLDVISKVGHVFFESFGERAKPAPVMERIVESKRLGRKGGLGFYTWDKPGGRRQDADKSNIESIVFGSQKPSPKRVDAKYFVDRLIYPMVNEAARVLEEGITTGPDQIDLAMIFGTGFPPFRGGLLRFADTEGPAKIRDHLAKLAGQGGLRLQPSEALNKIADSKSGFYFKT